MTEESKRCAAITKAGTRCKRTALPDSDYCSIHQTYVPEASARPPSQHKRCIAITKAGTQCRNTAQEGSDYCYIHRNYASQAAPAAETTVSEAPTDTEDELKALVAELNALTAELQQLVPEYAPPPYTPQSMLDLLKENLDRFTPEALRGLQESLEGTTVEDLRDIETWKGLWFTLNYLVQLEASERKTSLMNRLAGLPGVSTVSDIRNMLADTPPDEFLKIDTWKGIWFIMNYELQNQARDIKTRVVGGDEDEDS